MNERWKETYDQWKATPPEYGAPDEDEDDSPYCECHLEAMEDEEASNTCSCCGKPLV